MANDNLSKFVNKYTDFVKRDGVVKEQVRLEYLTRERWDEKWGYTKNSNQGCLQIARENGISEEEYRAMITRGRGGKPAAVSTRDPESSGPMPRTTAGEIGWRSSKTDCNLEQFGQLYRSPRFTMEAPDSDEITNYKFIFLG